MSPTPVVAILKKYNTKTEKDLPQMNNDNLKEIIKNYEEKLDLIYNSDHDELFKWRAVQHFRTVWYAPENETLPFAQRFNLAKKVCSVLLDNSRMAPTNGVVKLAEVAEKEVEALFFNTLLADDGGDIAVRQEHMEAFLIGMEELRVKHFPRSWKYKQDRHTASCYLCFFAPDDNFIYRHTEADKFAQYIEYGFDIGSGGSFRLDYYYQMCNAIIEELKQHPSLLEKQKKHLKDDSYYSDESLHLLAFNLIWCTKTYHLHAGIEYLSKKESIKAHALAQLQEKERLEKEEKINAILEEKEALEANMALYADIDLIGVQVTDHKTGDVGVIVSQDVNVVKVQYGTTEKKYVISKQFVLRPRFEDDEEIVEALTAYGAMKKRLDDLTKELEKLQ